MKSRIVILLFAIVSCWVISNSKRWKQNMYSYDAKGYYMYLPALFIKHDFRHVYLSDIDAQQHQLNKYTIGVSIFELPGFLLADLYVRHHAPAYEEDGYSAPYQVAGIAGTLFWTIIGFILLRGVLLLFFSDTVAALALLCIAFGTNLYYYTAFEQGMSHPFSFFIFSVVIYATVMWHRWHRGRHLYLLALFVALATIIRPVNGVVAIIPLLWGIGSAGELRRRIASARRFVMPLLLAGAIVLVTGMIQLAYWKYSSGHWLFYSYKNEGFDFRHPNILKGLFGFRKGWFVYTPLALVGMAGLYFLHKKEKVSAWPFIVYYAIAVYITFSWGNWWYGGGFGCRPLIETYAILVLPLGAIIGRVLQIRAVALRSAVLTVLLFFVVLNMFQSYQFYLRVLHYDRMCADYYWYIFGKTSINPDEAEKHLMSEKEYNDENRALGRFVTEK